MPYKFVPPVVKEGPIGGGRLFSFYKLLRGVSLLKINNKYVEMRFPYQEILESADVAYIGGSEYIVDDAEAAALTAAGYGSNLTAI